MREIKLFAGNANKKLAEDISRQIKVPVSKSNIRKFADGELKIKIQENIRGRDVFIIQSTP